MRGTLGLGAVLVVLVVAYVLTGNIERTPQGNASGPKPLFEFEAADITTLSLEQKSGPSVEALKTDDGTWRIARPFDYIPANQALWSQLAETVASLENKRSVGGPSNSLEDFDLAEPPLTIIVGTKGGQLSQVSFGGLDPTQINRYANLTGGEVFLASADAYKSLNRPLLELRDRRVFTVLDEGIHGIDYQRLASRGDSEELDADIAGRIRAINETYRVQADGTWHLEHPIRAVARKDRLNALAAILRFAMGREYIDDPTDLADYGLDPPFASLTVHGGGGASQVLHLGWIADREDKPGLFVKRADNPSVVVLDARLLALLPAEPEGFREKRVFTREAKKLTSIRYQDSRNDMLLLNDSESGWKLSRPAVDVTDQVAVSMYIAMLKSLEGQTFPDAATPGAEGGTIRLDFTFDGEPPSTVTFGGVVPDSDPIAFYARQDFGQVTTIPFEAFNVFLATPFTFRDKTLFNFGRADVRAIDITFEGRPLRFALRDSGWAVASPADVILESQSDAFALIDAFVSSTAVGIADPAPADDVMGVSNPILRVAFEIKDPLDGSSRTVGPIVVGNRKAASARQRFLKTPGEDTIFYVDQALIDDVRAALKGVVAAK